jgi:protein involved in polysaccharide export with SLBB domain
VPNDPPPSRAKRAGSSSIVSGDTLEIFVEEDDSFNGRYTVRERGDIIIPSLGRIPVAGMSVVDAGTRIRSELEASHLTKASVLVDRVGRAPVSRDSSRNSGASGAKPIQPLVTVYLSGKVSRPGQHRIPLPKNGKLGVYEAILISGGMSQFADPQKVHVLRNDETGRKIKIPVNIRAIENGLAKDPEIGEGDIVVVPEKVFGF